MQIGNYVEYSQAVDLELLVLNKTFWLSHKNESGRKLISPQKIFFSGSA